MQLVSLVYLYTLSLCVTKSFSVKTMTSTFRHTFSVTIIVAVSVIISNALEFSIIKHVMSCNQSIMNCTLEHNEHTISGSTFIFHEIPRMQLDFQFSVRPSSTSNYQMITNFSEDFCRFVKNSNTEPMANFIWKLLQSNGSNRLMGCPITEVNW